MSDHHSDQQLARGFLPFCHRRGSCEVWGRGANLWYAAAKALGFDVETIRCPDDAFVGQLAGICPGLKPLAPLPGRLRRPHRLPDIIFSDIGSFPTGPDSTEYWHKWTTPHLFFDHGVDDSVEGSSVGFCGGSGRIGGVTGLFSAPPGWTE